MIPLIHPMVPIYNVLYGGLEMNPGKDEPEGTITVRFSKTIVERMIAMIESEYGDGITPFGPFNIQLEKGKQIL